MTDLKNILVQNIKTTNEEFKRIFHGRGGYYSLKYKDITIDSIDSIILITLFNAIDFEKELCDYLMELINTTKHTSIILQKRYKIDSNIDAHTKIICGDIKEDNYALENGIKIKLNLLSNQNSGYFPDMKKGREYIQSISKDKNVLNLFSYTCAFSLFASVGGASMVTNVDMSKSALSLGRQNHHINNIATKNINFMPYNILKSFSRIKKHAPYDIIIIDPPSFQKGSFVASNDYNKVIKKLDLLSKKGTIVLACLNAPELDSNFLIDLFCKHASSFSFQKRIENLSEFLAINEEKSLKNLLFIKN